MIRWLIRWNRWGRVRHMREFLEATRQPRLVQSHTLMNYVRRCRDTVYGREHGFMHFHAPGDFRANVPLNTYEDLRPYIDREAGGETGVLLDSRDDLLMFAKTSGTTGQPKLIPVTASSQSEYRAASRLWNIFSLRDHPGILDGKILPIASPAHDGRTSAGIPIGSISGLVSGRQRVLIRRLYAVPQEIAAIEQGEARYYALMRIAVTADVSFLSAANPSTLILVAQLTDQRKEDLIRDVHDGTLAVDCHVPIGVKRAVRGHLRPNPKKARELESIAHRRGRLLPMDYWPHLALIGCWKGGPLHLYLRALPEFYGNVPVRDLGLLASEGRMSLPVSDEGAAGILNIRSGFYEFLPGEDDRPTQHSATLLAYELETGREYRLILTTAAGLYRYQMNDVVRVEDFAGSTPVISFVNKGQHIASVTGEKVSEYQAVAAFQQALSGRVPPQFFLCPAWDTIPYYTVVMQETDVLAIDGWPVCLDRIDALLCRLNIEYASKRESCRIGPMRLTVVADGSLDAANSLQAHTGQYKAVYLKTEIDYHRRFPQVRQVRARGQVDPPARAGVGVRLEEEE
jgi:hypothetical protein